MVLLISAPPSNFNASQPAVALPALPDPLNISVQLILLILNEYYIYYHRQKMAPPPLSVIASSQNKEAFMASFYLETNDLY